MMLEGIAGPEENVGYLSGAFNIANLILKLSAAAMWVLLPFISQAHRSDRHPPYLILKKCIKLISIICITLSVGIIFCGQWALAWFGQDYLLAYQPLVLLTITNSLLALSDCFVFYLIFHNKTQHVMISLGVILSISLGISTYLIPQFNMLGATLASLITSILSISYYFFLVRHTESSQRLNKI